MIFLLVVVILALEAGKKEIADNDETFINDFARAATCR
jgi:hypothetical protein